MKISTFLFLAFSITGCYVPLGAGSRIHICGQIVDENLNPILDTLHIESRVVRTMFQLNGNAVKSHYNYTVTDSKFCLEGSLAFQLVAWVKGKNIRNKYIEVAHRNFWKDDFKWVADRNTLNVERPEFGKYAFFLGNSKNFGFSVTRGGIYYSKNGGSDTALSPYWLADLYKMKGGDPTGMSFDSLFEYWDRFSPGMVKKKEWKSYGDTWTITKPEYLLDYSLFEKSGRLYLVPGPLVKTKFVPATIDSPICNFARLPPPPPIGNSAWQDTLLVAIGDSAVIDGFYFYFPWANSWGKAIIDPEIQRDSSGVVLNVAHVFAKAGDTKPFLFFPTDGRGYTERRKCLTKVEKMWAGEYNTQFVEEL